MRALRGGCAALCCWRRPSRRHRVRGARRVPPGVRAEPDGVTARRRGERRGRRRRPLASRGASDCSGRRRKNFHRGWASVGAMKTRRILLCCPPWSSLPPARPRRRSRPRRNRQRLTCRGAGGTTVDQTGGRHLQLGKKAHGRRRGAGDRASAGTVARVPLGARPQAAVRREHDPQRPAVHRGAEAGYDKDPDIEAGLRHAQAARPASDAQYQTPPTITDDDRQSTTTRTQPVLVRRSRRATSW